MIIRDVINEFNQNHIQNHVLEHPNAHLPITEQIGK